MQVFSYEFYKIFKSNYLVEHVQTAASDVLGYPYRRDIFYKINFGEMHSFLQHFGIHSFQIDFRRDFKCLQTVKAEKF